MNRSDPTQEQKKRTVGRSRTESSAMGLPPTGDHATQRCAPPALDPLTSRQQTVLLHLRGQLAVTGRVPSLRELAVLLGLTHRGSHDIVQRLTRKGYLERKVRRGSRALALTSAGRGDR